MIYIFLADGFEEIEAITPIDILRRAGAELCSVGITGKRVTGAHAISIECDITPEEADLRNAEMIILPGGMPGTQALAKSTFVTAMLKASVKQGTHLAAICAAPMILGQLGLLKGKSAVCFPGYEDKLTGAIYLDLPVITDGKITTSKSAGTALPFALELVRLLKGQTVANVIAASLQLPVEED
ncbi:MAG: DJ-1/PfpI family protein [Oscillospiraceae bacterium]|nr:DJ-1/PfpI family protein [Oscillospiraceae bacterium]